MADKMEVPIELLGIPETMEITGGWWQPCSGCHESNEGAPTGPFSKILNCHLGGGCSECGGIGAIWDNGEGYDLLAAEQAATLNEPAQPADEDPRKDAARISQIADLMREVGFISDKYSHWREVYPLAVDDPEYDCFAAGFKIALASVEAAIAAKREGER